MEAPPDVRVYLTGEVMVERGRRLLRERDLPSRQGRLAFAYLCLQRGEPVAKDVLADALWGDDLPPRWEVALNAIASKLRVALGSVGLDRTAVLPVAFGCYALRLPGRTWIDVDAAHEAVHDAEGALRAGASEAAYGDALVASIITRRPFLPAEGAAWVEERRGQLAADRLRALDCMVQCLLRNGEMELAELRAEEAVALDPYRESSYQSLMELHASVGNRAAALRVYERCVIRLRDDLGVSPTSALQTLHRRLLVEAAV